jgi:hypothetical protein
MDKSIRTPPPLPPENTPPSPTPVPLPAVDPTRSCRATSRTHNRRVVCVGCVDYTRATSFLFSFYICYAASSYSSVDTPGYIYTMTVGATSFWFGSGAPIDQKPPGAPDWHWVRCITEAPKRRRRRTPSWFSHLAEHQHLNLLTQFMIELMATHTHMTLSSTTE